MSEQVRVRFAPSPTGYLHVGGARTALYNWLYARKTGGKFILRVEDTDQARSTEEALQMQLNDLKWLGLDWDEGVDVGGEYGPYKQSERLHIYKEHAQKLLESKKAYYCFCSDELLEKKKNELIAQGKPPHYDGTCRSLSYDEAKAKMQKGEKAVVRFAIPSKKEYGFKDIIRDQVTFPSDMVGDFVILRSDGMPVYNFCCVIDDALMKITHVLRAEEHLSNTLRQLMLYEAFDFKVPQFGHLSIILGSDRQKLSKRHGATSVFEYNSRGFLPEALNNFIALLGWSSPNAQEIMSINEMIEQFGLDRFNPAAAVFDEQKLAWMNSVHLRNLSTQELWKRVNPILKEAGLEFEADEEWIQLSLEAFKTAMITLKDAVELYRPLADSEYKVQPEGMPVVKTGEKVIRAWKSELEKISKKFLSEDEFLNLQNQVSAQTSCKGKDLFPPIRVAVVGKPQGVELKKLVPLLPVSSLKKRVEKCLNEISAG